MEVSALASKVLSEHVTTHAERLARYVAGKRAGHAPSSSSSSSSSSSFRLQEVEDSAASIITELLRRPRMLVEGLALCKQRAMAVAGEPAHATAVCFACVSRLLHPYFTDSSSTTALLFEALAWQAEACQAARSHGSNGGQGDDKQRLARALFVDDPAFATDWGPLEQPLPVLPNCASETLLTTVLKVYAVRVDVTLYFRDVLQPVLPSIVAFLGVMPTAKEVGFQTVKREDGEVFKSAVKVATRLLSHVFSDRALVGLPPGASAMAQALFALGGAEALYTYLFSLLLLPNLVRLLSAPAGTYDTAGEPAFVLAEVSKCYAVDAWWPADGFHENNYHPAGALVWLTWRLFSVATALSDTQIAQLRTNEFFEGGPFTDTSGIADTRLRIIVTTLRRTVKKGCQVVLQLPLDAKGCEVCDVDVAESAATLRGNLPHLAKEVDARMASLLPRPPETLRALVLSVAEADMVFEAVRAAIAAPRPRAAAAAAAADVVALREELDSYRAASRRVPSTSTSTPPHALAYAQQQHVYQRQHQLVVEVFRRGGGDVSAVAAAGTREDRHRRLTAAEAALTTYEAVARATHAPATTAAIVATAALAAGPGGAGDGLDTSTGFYVGELLELPFARAAVVDASSSGAGAHGATEDGPAGGEHSVPRLRQQTAASARKHRPAVHGGVVAAPKPASETTPTPGRALVNGSGGGGGEGADEYESSAFLRRNHTGSNHTVGDRSLLNTTLLEPTESRISYARTQRTDEADQTAHGREMGFRKSLRSSQGGGGGGDGDLSSSRASSVGRRRGSGPAPAKAATAAGPSTSISTAASTPAPFPEHLRQRLRQPGNAASDTGSAAGTHGGTGGVDLQTEVAALLGRYKQLSAAPAATPAPSLRGPAPGPRTDGTTHRAAPPPHTHVQSPEGPRGGTAASPSPVARRSLSAPPTARPTRPAVRPYSPGRSPPKVPPPPPPNARILSPTKTLQRRMEVRDASAAGSPSRRASSSPLSALTAALTAVSEAPSAFLRDIDGGVTPGLREEDTWPTRLSLSRPAFKPASTTGLRGSLEEYDRVLADTLARQRPAAPPPPAEVDPGAGGRGERGGPRPVPGTTPPSTSTSKTRDARGRAWSPASPPGGAAARRSPSRTGRLASDRSRSPASPPLQLPARAPAVAVKPALLQSVLSQRPHASPPSRRAASSSRSPSSPSSLASPPAPTRAPTGPAARPQPVDVDRAAALAQLGLPADERIERLLPVSRRRATSPDMSGESVGVGGGAGGGDASRRGAGLGTRASAQGALYASAAAAAAAAVQNSPDSGARARGQRASSPPPPPPPPSAPSAAAAAASGRRDEAQFAPPAAATAGSPPAPRPGQGADDAAASFASPLSPGSPLSQSSAAPPQVLGDTPVGEFLYQGGRSTPDILWLQRGVVVTKHGRYGKPKQKTVKYVEKTCKLEWTAVSSYNPFHACLPMSIASPTRHEAKPPSALSMATVTAIVGGAETAALRKAKPPHPECCVSVVTYDRTLHMTLRDADEAARMRRALRDIVDSLGIHTVKF